MATMEAWLAELMQEMEGDPVCSLINNSCEELGTTIGEDFLHSLSIDCKNTNSAHQWDFDSNLFEQFTPSPIISNGNIDDNNYTNNNHTSNNNGVTHKDVSSFVQENQQAEDNNEDDNSEKREAVSGGGKKRKRQPSQVQDHIIAERKRRELLSQLFISLSAIVPGLKKTDKTSVLGEAIKHMKQLQEKVKILEEVAAKRTVQSLVVRRSKLTIIDDDSGDDNVSSSTLDNGCGIATSRNDSLPEIEANLSGNTLLLRIYCEKQKGVLAKLCTEAEKHDLSITNFSVVPFGTLALDITTVAQIEGGFNKNVKDFVKSLRSALQVACPQCNYHSSEDGI